MKKAVILWIALIALAILSADAKDFLTMREIQITPEIIEQVKLNNDLVRGPSFNFSSTPYNLPDAADIADPLTGRFYEDTPWLKDFTRHIVNPEGATLYLYYSNPEHFNISQPDPGNPLKLLFEPIPTHWYGSELMVITVSDEPLDRIDRATATAIIRLNVTSVPDPPIFHSLPAGNIFYTNEDTSFSLNFRDYVYCVDSEATNFDLFVAQTQVTLPYNVAITQSPGVNGHNVMFDPRQDYNGTATFIITAVDRQSNGFSTREIYVVVLPENDPPEILSYSPPQGTIEIDQDENILFNVDVIDVDGDVLTHTWTLSGVFNDVPFSTVVSTTNSLDYLFDVPGTYTLVYTVADAQETLTLQWTIIVSPIGPIFTPWGATFDHGISVVLTSPPGFAGATIYYTLDGSIPTISSPVYDQPIDLPELPNIENLKTIRAFFTHPSFPPSQVVSSTYRITGRVADPVFNPVGGLYYSQTSVSISSPNLSAQIYYTIDGSDPVPGNPGTILYTVPVVVPTMTSLTIKAIAIRTDWIDSNIVAHSYSVTGVVTINSYTLNPPPPPDGEFYTVEYGSFMPLTIDGLSITPPSAVLWYTLDNSVPGPSNPSSMIYTTGTVIELTCPTWVTFRAYNADWLPSNTYSFYYDVRTRTYIEFFANGTIFDPAPGSSIVPITVAINTATVPPGAPVYYTTDGSDPVEDPALLYMGPIQVNQTTIIKVLSHYPDICPSQIYVGVFEITGRVDTPIFDPTPSSYFNPISLSMSTILPGTRIYYTLNGADPLPTDVSPDSYEFLGPFILGTGIHHIRARAYKENWEPSFIRDGYYNIGVLPTPVFNLEAGLYFDPIIVRLSVPSVPTASIFYTTDGSDPTLASTLYDDATGIPVGLQTSMVIKAIAWQGGWTQSDIATRSYQVTGTVTSPVFVPGGGDYPSTVNVSISTSTPGAQIKYTLDGLDPTADYGIDYIGPVNIASSSTLKARAFRSNWRPSLVSVGEYTIFGNIANPVFTPGPGTYTAPVNVYVSVNPPDATIWYTLDGSDPSPVNGTSYVPGNPILISSDTMIRAIAVKTGWNSSAIVNGQYFITGTVATPVFNPPSGQYATAQTVSISSATAGATIIYTTDGTEPSLINGLVYSGTLNISVNTIIKAFAYLAGWNDSQVGTATYVINGSVGNPVFSPSGGYYNSAQSVSINVYPTDSTIRYTLDGSAPSLVNGFTYNGPLNVSEHTLIRAYAYKANWVDSGVTTAEYFFVTANPVFSIPSGSYPDTQTLALSTPTPGASIRYTVDGSDPSDINGILYSAPIIISESTTVKAIAYRSGWINSNVITNAYIINGAVSNPLFSVAGGDYYAPFNVSISTVPPNATIYYTVDGSIPSDTNGFVYAGPIAVNVNTTLSAIAYLSNWQPSGITTAVYNLISSPVTFNPPGGLYSANQLVTLSTINVGSVIYYTIDGSDPIIGISPIFDPLNPILVDANLTIKAISQVAGWSLSIISSATYVINIPLPVVATPQINPPSGVYTEALNVSISVVTADADIIYTTDGSEPTLLNGTVYTVPFTVNTNTTIKARAFKAGWDPSTIATAQYIIVLPVLTVAPPVFNPGAGIYNEAINVIITSDTPGATIRYTLDGTEPSETIGTVYAGPVNIAMTTTIKAIAYMAGMNTSQITNSSYVINIIIPVVEAPLFSIPSGTYQNPINVEISSPTADAIIRYTTDGSNPSPTFGMIYSGGINVPMDSSLFIKAIAYKDGWTPSQIVSANYVVTGQVSDIIFSIPGGTYATAQNVILSTLTDGATIRYTLDGSDPTAGSPLYTTAINVPLNSSVTIKARGFKSNWLPSNIGTEIYNVTGTTAFDQPVLTPAPGTYANAISVTIGSPIPNDAVIYYTLDGTVPAADNGTLYGAPIPIDAALTLRAVAIKAGWLPAYITGSYDFAAAAPVFAPPAGSYASAQNVALTSTTIGATIRYTTDGTDPSPVNGMDYIAPIIVDVNQTIKAYSIKAGYQDSPIVSATYAIGTFIPVVATPVLTPASGTYPTAQNVSIATTTDGATIRYTTDGSEPDLASPLFLVPINVPLNTTMTIKAKAFKTDWMPSATATEVYIITGTVSDVVFNPPGGSYSAAQNVLLSSGTEGAYFRYTMDGSEPTDTSTLYTVPISVPLNTSMTIKAKAYKSGWLPSTTGTEIYNVTGQVVLTQPVFSPSAGNYNTPQMVSISAPIPADAILHYTIDGSEPSETNGMLYTGAFEIAQTTLVKAIAFKAGWQNSSVASAQYSFGVIAPSFAPVSGIYTTPQSVTISSPTVGALIRYTTDGSDPSPTFGMIYSGAINVPMDSSLFIKAIAYKDGWTPSQIVSANYVVTGQVSDIIFSIPGGTYATAQNVILSTLTDGATIRYTMDGSDPTTGSTLYTTAINVPLNSSVTIKARGFKSNWLPSNIGTEIYNVTGTTAFDQPVLTPAPGTYANAISVTIGSPIPNDAVIYYTLDGTVPAADNGTLYAAPIPIDAALTLRAVAIKAGWLPAYITGSYDFAAAAPVFTPPAGSYASAQNVILTSTTIGATIRYTTDGTDPSPVNGMDFVAPITVSINQTIKAYSIKAGYQDSPIVSATYAIGTFVPVVATPVFNPLGGTYATAQDVSITTSTPGATIHYTIDGSDPDMTSPLYGAPINIPLDTVMTLKAIAYRTDWIESQIAVATYNITGTVADVIFTPPAGSYSTAQSVVLTTTTEGAYFRYTTDGSEPTNASTLYTTAISVPLNTMMTIKARAYKTGWNPSNTGTAVYNVTGQVAWIPPIFNPTGGNYASEQMVSISIPNPADAIVHYTTDGSIPSSTNGLLYTGPISITQTTNLQAIAFKPGWNDSVVASAQYNFGVNAPVFSPPAGTYQSAQNIAITSSTPDAVIRYTLDGSDPTDSNGIIYSAPIYLGEDTNTIIKAKAFKGGWAESPLALANYIISGTVANVVFNPMGGIFQAPVSVVLTTSTPGAVIRYTMDGSEPNAGSTQYTTAITVPLNSTWTIRAKAFRTGWISSTTLSQTYTVTGQVAISAPVFSVAAGTYNSARTVSINTPIPADATIRYTTDGSDPNASSPVYSAPITVPLNSTMTIKAMAFRSNWIPSPIYSATYVITGQVALPVPMFTPPAGVYQTAQSVMLNTATIPADAVLRYTLDGSEPNQGSPAYQNPISLAMNSTTTIKVKGFSPDWIPSTTLEATYVITGQVVFNTPEFNPAPGIYTAEQMITINSTMPADATIRYTLDGSEPNAASPVYSSAIPLPLNSTLTIKVKAFKTDWTASETHTGFYTTTGAVSIQLPVFTPAPGLFTTPQNIVLNTNTIPSGATLRYTLDGSDPNESSAIYSTPIPVNSGQTVTIRVRAYTANWLPSQIHTGVFTVTGQVTIETPVFSPAAGTYQTSQTVAINTTTTPAGATIRYTMDGSEPTAASPVYSTPINLALNTNTTIRAKAYLENWVASETYTAVYVITGTVAINAPVFTPAAGTYQTAQSVTINSMTTPAGATIRYTTDGSDPTATSPVYSAPISVPLNTMMTIKARAFLTGWTPSQVYASVYIVTGQIVLPTPMFTPPAGTYQTQQNVTLNTNTTPTGSTLRYTLDGSVPTESSPAYAAGNPIALPMNAITTITVRAFKADWTPSNSVSATYNITGQVSFPAIVFSPPQGTYTSAQTITVSPAIPAAATIRYTLDGSEPTATSTIYTAPINLAVNTNTTLKVKGFLTDWTPSVTHTAIYTITGEVSINTPVFSPAPGIYTTAQSVSINTTTAPAGAIIRYTTDGSDPNPTSPIYSTPISIPLNTTMQIKARAFATNWLASPIYTGNYTVTGTASIPDPVFTPPAGTYSTAQTLVLNTNTMPLGATLHYSLDGSEPTETHPQYSLPILLQGPAEITVKVKAFAANWITSQTYTAVYNMTGQVTLMQPLFSPSPGVYTSAQSVNVIAQPNPSSAVIRFTMDGSDPSASSPIFTDPIQIPLNTAMYEIRIRGYLDGWDPSTVASGIYTITGQVMLPAQPFTPAPGTYTTAQTISIAAPTLPIGATLRYTLDGSEPTADSPAYTVPLQIPQNTTQIIKIKGFATDWIPSETITSVYNITGTVAEPVMSIPGGLYSIELHLELSSATAGATIRYTTDGSDPDESSPLYSEPIVIPEQAQDYMIKAKAFKTDWISSSISTQTYSVLLLPIDVRAFSYGGYIRVLWNSPIAAKVLNGFNIYRRRTSEASFTRLNATPILNQLGADYYYDDYEISVNTSYQYYVTAIYNGEESLPSMTTTIEYQSQDLQISDASYAYPNPATSSTKIKLVLSRNDNVQVAVSIYDFAGKKVKTLTVPPTNTNLIEILWDLNNTSGKKVGRGTYFARITANDGVNTSQKVIKISVK